MLFLNLLHRQGIVRMMLPADVMACRRRVTRHPETVVHLAIVLPQEAEERAEEGDLGQVGADP